MAEGGDDKEDNPYSFKRFIKSKTNCRVSSDSDSEHSEEDGAVDLLENSCPLSRGSKIGVCLKSEIHEIHEIQSLSRNPLSV